jgi:hypothetical protein
MTASAADEVENKVIRRMKRNSVVMSKDLCVVIAVVSSTFFFLPRNCASGVMVSIYIRVGCQKNEVIRIWNRRATWWDKGMLHNNIFWILFVAAEKYLANPKSSVN